MAVELTRPLTRNAIDRAYTDLVARGVRDGAKPSAAGRAASREIEVRFRSQFPGEELPAYLSTLIERGATHGASAAGNEPERTETSPRAAEEKLDA